MESSLTNLVHNLDERTYKNYQDCDCFLEYESIEDNSIKYKCISSNKDYSRKIDEELRKRFRNLFKISNTGINKFILLLQEMFNHINTWMIGKNPVKHHSLKRKIFTAT